MYRKMWFLFLITGVVLAGILAACGSPAAAPVDQQPAAAQPADDVEAVTAAVNQVWEQYASSLNAGDVDRYMALWADNAIQLPPDSLPLVGKETLRAGLESEVKAITYDMKIINEEVNVSGDQAVARGTYAATITPKDGSEPVSINGKYMTLLKRQPDGSWKIFRDIYNSNVPPAAPAEPQPADDIEAVTAAVNQVWDQYISSLNAGDIDRYMALWADDGIQLPPDAPPVTSMETLRAGLQRKMDRVTFDFDINNEEVNVSDDMAVARGTYGATVTPKDGSEPITIDGKYMTLLKRQPDGTWKIYRDIFNSNVPPATDDVEAVTAAVNKVWEQYASSLNAGDVDSYMALWADDAMQLPPDSLPIVGKETLRAGLESELEAITYDMEITNKEVNVSGDMAVARGTYAATITFKDGSDPISIDGKYMTLLKRQPDGSWKIFRDIYNSNVPPASDEISSVPLELSEQAQITEPTMIDESAIIGVH